MRFFRTDTNEEVWSVTVEGPGVVEIPALQKDVGVPVWVRNEYADGTVHEAGK